MDVSSYGIRVIRTRKRGVIDGMPPCAKAPIDVEGTILELTHASMQAAIAMEKLEWYKIFFHDLSIQATIRWDNDFKSTIRMKSLELVSTGKVSMYIPLFDKCPINTRSKFDFRRAEDRRPKTHLPEPKLNDIITQTRTIKVPTRPRRKGRTSPKKSVLWSSYAGTITASSSANTSSRSTTTYYNQIYGTTYFDRARKIL